MADVKKFKSVKDVMGHFDMGPTRFAQATGMYQKTCEHISAGRVSRFDTIADLIADGLRHRDYRENK